MSHRIGRVAHIIRDVVSDTLSTKLSDPRISRFTSVTRVELSPDLRVADVYFSVMVEEADGVTTMKGLESARGLLQSRVARGLDMRTCPVLRLHLDLSLKKASQVIHMIEESVGPSPEPTRRIDDEADEGASAETDRPKDSLRYGDDE